MAQPTSLATIEEDLAQIRRLRMVSMVEATTLLILVAVAVPLKHALGYPAATKVIGPVHGAAFVAYAWCLIATVSAGGWSRREIARLSIAAFVPFAGFLNGPLLQKEQARILALLERYR